jgi:GxxExxY protein
VYERALLKELASRGIEARGQVGLPVSYKGHIVGEYIADILVEGELVVELKCADSFSNENVAQCIKRFEGVRQENRSADELPKAKSPVEADHQLICV